MSILAELSFKCTTYIWLNGNLWKKLLKIQLAKAIKMNFAVSLPSELAQAEDIKTFYSISSIVFLVQNYCHCVVTLRYSPISQQRGWYKASAQFKVPLLNWRLIVIAFKCTTLIRDQLHFRFWTKNEAFLESFWDTRMTEAGFGRLINIRGLFSLEKNLKRSLI